MEKSLEMIFSAVKPTRCFYKSNLVIIHTAVHYLIRETIFIRVVIIKWHNIAEPNKFVKCDFILHLKKTPTPCCQIQSTSNHVPKVKVSIREKKMTQQLNHYHWLESQVFVTRLPLELCQKWSDFESVKTKMTYCTLLSMQSLLLDIFGPILIDSFSKEKIKLQNLLLACSQNTFLAITLWNQKMAPQIFYML